MRRSKSYVSKRLLIRKSDQNSNSKHKHLKQEKDNMVSIKFNKKMPKEIVSVNFSKKKRIKHYDDFYLENKDIMTTKPSSSKRTPTRSYRKANINEYIQKSMGKRCKSSKYISRDIPNRSISANKLSNSKLVISHTISQFKQVFMHDNYNKPTYRFSTSKDSIENKTNIKVHMSNVKRRIKQRAKLREEFKQIDSNILY